MSKKKAIAIIDYMKENKMNFCFLNGEVIFMDDLLEIIIA